MIEAKAYGAWSNKQASSKIKRFMQISDYYQTIKNSARPVTLHLLQMSPQPPQVLEVLPQSWPGGHKQLPHVKFKINTDGSIYEVKRCRMDGIVAKEGGYWRIVNKLVK